MSENRHRLTALTGTVALGLDALASVSYGPEAIVVALAVAGSAGLGWTLPVTGLIVLLLLVLVACYRQVIAAYPDGGGAYSVAKHNLGTTASLVAAASLVVDYVLNVAVSVSAGVAALTSAIPGLLAWTPQLCLAVLFVLTLVNLRGAATSARLFILPAALFVFALGAVIVTGLLRGAPVPSAHLPSQPVTVGSVGLLLVVTAFANGCSALTGVEAIANAAPGFRKPRANRARRAEAGLGATLGLLLIGLALLIERFHIHPVPGRTVLSLVTQGSFGDGFGYLAVQFVTVVLLALAANTSFGGLPVLAARLAGDGFVPHIFGLRADRLVYRYGVVVLAVLAGLLLVFSGGVVNVLVPMFAVGVFIGFFLCQIGMVRHWRAERGARWRRKATVNGIGAVLTAIAAIVTTATKFLEGAWLIVLVIPLLAWGFLRVRAAYDRIGAQLGSGARPESPRRHETLIVLPIVAIDRLACELVSTALAMGNRIVAVHVSHPGEFESARAMERAWHAWRPEIPFTLLASERRELGAPLARYVRGADAERVVVLIGEVSPQRRWERLLKNYRGAVIGRRLSRSTDAVVCRYRMPLAPAPVPRESREYAHAGDQ
ncbi:APC family permease [Sciscionella sediminilitoris]|uniref:APC family permease n=1 Tax=Sciscionella sediminilitoris TaxID=1445613 RepID=UPI00068ACDE0|nr:APC family permease [Sciscionella sp. SE31]